MHAPPGITGLVVCRQVALDKDMVCLQQHHKHALNSPTPRRQLRVAKHFGRVQSRCTLVAVAEASQQPTALITGCSSGIGRETALLLSEKVSCR